jgi:hypothetical protein
MTARGRGRWHRPGGRRAATLVAAIAMVAAACAGTSRATFPPIGSTPQPAGDATVATAQAVTGALAATDLQAAVANRAYRPPEGPLLAAAPRTVLQAALPDDPDHGFIVIYELASAAEAAVAANDQAAYVASGIGRVQFTPDAHFVLRVVGSTVVFSWWSPGAVTDAHAGSIEQALETVGVGVAVAG